MYGIKNVKFTHCSDNKLLSLIHTKNNTEKQLQEIERTDRQTFMYYVIMSSIYVIENIK